MKPNNTDRPETLYNPLVEEYWNMNESYYINVEGVWKILRGFDKQWFDDLNNEQLIRLYMENNAPNENKFLDTLDSNEYEFKKCEMVIMSHSELIKICPEYGV